MIPAPPPAWYAMGLRWIASGLASFADTIDRRAPEPWPLEPSPEFRSSDESLMDARHRAQNSGV